MEKIIHVEIGPVSLEGALHLPPNAHRIVLFAHGSGSSRKSPRNNFVAKILNEAGLATLLIDLLTPEEDQIYKTRFNIELLFQRLNAIVVWLQKNPQTQSMSLALFGASTGAAAALYTAASFGKKIAAVVSRGGRPDLAIPVLDQVTCPTLFIVGGEDHEVLELNKTAFAHLKCKKQLKIVEGATHLFEEPGTLDQAAELAKDWFQKE